MGAVSSKLLTKRGVPSSLLSLGEATRICWVKAMCLVRFCKFPGVVLGWENGDRLKATERSPTGTGLIGILEVQGTPPHVVWGWQML